MIRNGDVIHGYTILATANGMALAHSETAPDPYVVWFIDEDGCGVRNGSYLQTKEDAEWDFCCKAFPWFEDNAPVNMIEDEAEKRIQDFNDFLDEAKNAVDMAKALVEDMVLEHGRLQGKKEAPQEESAEEQKNISNPNWTATPKLSIDEHGISLSGVYLPGISRFMLKDSGNLDGLFILNMEMEVELT